MKGHCDILMDLCETDIYNVNIELNIMYEWKLI